jgi:DNA-binding transcriptional regulator GbsR (MarR family)
MSTASTAKVILENPGSESESRSPRVAASPDPLLEIQLGMAGIFADLADLLGNPSSLGSIYGLLFASPKALSMEEIVDRLDISTGTASQGLRRLVEMQAITPRKEEGERVTRYEAKLELRPFVAMFLEQRLLPKIGHSAERIETLNHKLSSMPDDSREELGIRMERASKWHRRAKTFLPLVRKFLGG